MKLDHPEFDFVESRYRAVEGMDRASAATRVMMWKIQADQWLSSQMSGTEIAADDLVRAIGLPDIGANHNNVVGAWFSAQAKQKKIIFAGKFCKSQRVDRHVGLQRIWKVL